MGCGVSDNLGGAFPKKVPTTMEIGALLCNRSAPLQGRLIYSNSRVHGNRTLYVEAGSYHYKLLLLNCMVPSFLPRGDVEEVNSEELLIITTYYYTMLQQLLLHCYFMLYITVG